MGDASFEAMLATKHEAERRMRDAFQASWGSFWKCPACGARCSDTKTTDHAEGCAGVGRPVLVGYSDARRHDDA